MRTLEYGTGHEKTLLFLPCTAEPEWAFADAVGLLSQDYHVIQIVYDGHGETGEDFISVETTVDEVTDWLKAQGITRLNAAYMQAFVQKLRDMGYERVELIDTTTGKFMTPKEAKRLMLYGSTMLVGRK